MAYRECELRSIQRVEMKLPYPLCPEECDMLDRYTGRDQLACLVVIFEAIESVLEPFGYRGTTLPRKSGQLRESSDGQNPGHNG